MVQASLGLQGLELRIQDSGFRLQDAERGLGFRV